MDYECRRTKTKNETVKESFNAGSVAVSRGSHRKERDFGGESLILD